MVRISVYKNKEREGGVVQVREMSSRAALDELVSYLCCQGFVEEHTLLEVPGNSKADTVNISITTHLLGPTPTPYLVVFEGLLETDMAGLGVVVDWFARATKSASARVLHQVLS